MQPNDISTIHGRLKWAMEAAGYNGGDEVAAVLKKHGVEGAMNHNVIAKLYRGAADAPFTLQLLEAWVSITGVSADVLLYGVNVSAVRHVIGRLHKTLDELELRISGNELERIGPGHAAGAVDATDTGEGSRLR